MRVKRDLLRSKRDLLRSKRDLLTWAYLQGVSADERRFFQSAPFESEEHKRYAEMVIALLQPSVLAPLDAQLPNRTMMSWSPGIVVIYIYIYIYIYILVLPDTQVQMDRWRVWASRRRRQC